VVFQFSTEAFFTIFTIQSPSKILTTVSQLSSIKLPKVQTAFNSTSLPKQLFSLRHGSKPRIWILLWPSDIDPKCLLLSEKQFLLWLKKPKYWISTKKFLLRPPKRNRTPDWSRETIRQKEESHKVYQEKIGRFFEGKKPPSSNRSNLLTNLSDWNVFLKLIRVLKGGNQNAKKCPNEKRGRD